MSHDDFDFEPVRGIPAPLPRGETLLWQGSPTWTALAVNAYHVRKVAIYFAALVAWRSVYGILQAESAVSIVAGCALVALLGGMAVGVLSLLAYAGARSAVYSITSRRVLIRHGIAVPLTLNVPFCAIQAADLTRRRDDNGDIALSLIDSARIGYLITWPYLNPRRLAHPQPSLRAIAACAAVARLLGDSLAADAAQATALQPIADRVSERRPDTQAAAA